MSEECASVDDFDNAAEAFQPPAQQILDQDSDHASGSEDLIEIQRVIELTRQLQRKAMLQR